MNLKKNLKLAGLLFLLTTLQGCSLKFWGSSEDNSQIIAIEDQITKMNPSVKTYLKQISKKLKRNWRPATVMDSEAKRELAADGKLRTEVEIILTPEGEISDLRILNASGVEQLDQEALRAARLAAPFPEVPKILLEENGLATIPYAFIYSGN